jgi:hypothetical protein
MIFCWWYVIFNDGYIDGKIKNIDGITYSFPVGDMLNLPMDIPTEWSG